MKIAPSTAPATSSNGGDSSASKRPSDASG